MADVKTHKVEPMLPPWADESMMPGGKPKPDYPSVCLDLRAVPEAADIPLTKRVRLVVVGSLKAMRNDEGKGDFTIEVEEAGIAPEEGGDSGRVSRKNERSSAPADNPAEDY